MKKVFETPVLKTEVFVVEDIITVSGFAGSGGENETDEMV